jgi:virulence-associated protein VagC
MKATVSEQGILIPKKYLEGAREVDIRVEQGSVIITPITTDPIKQLGKHPVTVDINDASKEHDKYIYRP